MGEDLRELWIYRMILFLRACGFATFVGDV